MQRYPLKYAESGHVFISQEDRLDRLVDELVDRNYAMDFCLALDFDPFFIQRLMMAGFLVMSTRFARYSSEYLLLPKLHTTRSVLFFPNLHIKKSIKRFVSRYELRVDTDFDDIVDRCVAVHGDDWLTAPLLKAVRSLRGVKTVSARPISFGVYRDEELKAGEFGVLAGGVYTSYSGYYDEDNAGSVQMILMARHLEERGAPFLDLGMPLPYKDDLGATNIPPGRFVPLFREGRRRKLHKPQTLAL
ncbi:MAG: GNAT family N-acetyltransferase [Treponema sp.]|jgi:Leu/Phe-tRNA-protein transferase|nr:GNAT family N-acetyltransferase [Treponema sp.]